jgi:hypothetical protein
MMNCMKLIIALWLIHFLATVFMTGVIWFVQLSQYPLFALVDAPSMPTFSTAHANRTTWVVGPPMLLEVATALGLLYWPVPGVEPWVWWVNWSLMLVIWVATAVLSVPCHHALSKGYDRAVIDLLVHSNWVRTLAWSARSGLMAWVAWGLLTTALTPRLG